MKGDPTQMPLYVVGHSGEPIALTNRLLSGCGALCALDSLDLTKVRLDAIYAIPENAIPASVIKFLMYNYISVLTYKFGTNRWGQRAAYFQDFTFGKTMKPEIAGLIGKIADSAEDFGDLADWEDEFLQTLENNDNGVISKMSGVMDQRMEEALQGFLEEHGDTAMPAGHDSWRDETLLHKEEIAEDFIRRLIDHPGIEVAVIELKQDGRPVKLVTYWLTEMRLLGEQLLEELKKR